MTFKVSDNQYGRPHPSDSWASGCKSKQWFLHLLKYVVLQPWSQKTVKVSALYSHGILELCFAEAGLAEFCRALCVLQTVAHCTVKCRHIVLTLGWRTLAVNWPQEIWPYGLATPAHTVYSYSPQAWCNAIAIDWLLADTLTRFTNAYNSSSTVIC